MRILRHVRRTDVIDLAVIAVFLTSAMVAATSQIGRDDHEDRSLDIGGYLCIVVAGMSLTVRRRWPRVTLAITTAALLFYVVRDYSGGPVYLVPLVAIYTLASQQERREAAPPAIAAAVVITGAGAISEHDGTSWVHVVYLSWAVGALFLGEAARTRREHLVALEERARYLEESHEEEARRRVAEERLRLARDIHDVVAHSLASISVQAGVGAHVIDKNPAEARAALLAIKQVSGEALGELRATLGVLRKATGDDDLPLAPPPGLTGLGALVARVDQAGVPVVLIVDDGVPVLAPAIDAAAYRIVQESLTNVLRHAGPARATVAVTAQDGCVEIEVGDDGRGAAASPPADGETSGHGLAGMRERVAALGGTLDAGPRPGGGFLVRARLPVGVAVPT